MRYILCAALILATPVCARPLTSEEIAHFKCLQHQAVQGCDAIIQKFDAEIARDVAINQLRFNRKLHRGFIDARETRGPIKFPFKTSVHK